MDQKKMSDYRAHRLELAVARYTAHTTAGKGSGAQQAKGRLMSERYGEQAVALDLVHESVRSVTNPAGVSVMNLFWYYSFGRQVYKLWRNTPPSCLESELESVRHRWQMRGLKPEVLAQVQAAVLKMLGDSGIPRPRLDWLTGANPKVD